MVNRVGLMDLCEFVSTVQNETVRRDVRDSSESWRLVQNEERRRAMYQGCRTCALARRLNMTSLIIIIIIIIVISSSLIMVRYNIQLKQAIAQYKSQKLRIAVYRLNVARSGSASVADCCGSSIIMLVHSL